MNKKKVYLIVLVSKSVKAFLNDVVPIEVFD